jgi:hypothetical protein
MKKLIILGIIVAIFTACGGSSSVDKSISQVEKALAKVEKNKGKMTEEDWRNLEKEVEAPLKVISEALESDKVGIIGKMKILAVTAKWATVLAEAGLSELEKRTGVEREKWANELEKAATEFGSQIEQAAKEFESENGSDLEKAAKALENSDFLKAIEKAAQELQKNVEAESQ